MMRKTVFGGVAVAAALALFGSTGVAASEPVDSAMVGGQPEIESGSAGLIADIDQLPGKVMLELVKADDAAVEAQVEKPAAEVTPSEPKASQPEQETEPETEAESNDGVKASQPTATPEPTEAPERHDGGSDSGSDH